MELNHLNHRNPIALIQPIEEASASEALTVTSDSVILARLTSLLTAIFGFVRGLRHNCGISDTRTQITGSPKRQPCPSMLMNATRLEENTMNSDQLQGKWKQMKGSIREHWGKLTDEDVDIINGQTSQLVGKIQERYGVAKEEARSQVEEWMHEHSQESELERRRAS